MAESNNEDEGSFTVIPLWGKVNSNSSTADLTVPRLRSLLLHRTDNFCFVTRFRFDIEITFRHLEAALKIFQDRHRRLQNARRQDEKDDQAEDRLNVNEDDNNDEEEEEMDTGTSEEEPTRKDEEYNMELQILKDRAATDDLMFVAEVNVKLTYDPEEAIIYSPPSLHLYKFELKCATKQISDLVRDFNRKSSLQRQTDTASSLLTPSVLMDFCLDSWDRENLLPHLSIWRLDFDSEYDINDGQRGGPLQDESAELQQLLFVSPRLKGRVNPYGFPKTLATMVRSSPANAAESKRKTSMQQDLKIRLIIAPSTTIVFPNKTLLSNIGFDTGNVPFVADPQSGGFMIINSEPEYRFVESVHVPRIGTIQNDTFLKVHARFIMGDHNPDAVVISEQQQQQQPPVSLSMKITSLFRVMYMSDKRLDPKISLHLLNQRMQPERRARNLSLALTIDPLGKVVVAETLLPNLRLTMVFSDQLEKQLQIVAIAPESIVFGGEDEETRREDDEAVAAADAETAVAASNAEEEALEDTTDVSITRYVVGPTSPTLITYKGPIPIFGGRFIEYQFHLIKQYVAMGPLFVVATDIVDFLHPSRLLAVLIFNPDIFAYELDQSSPADYLQRCRLSRLINTYCEGGQCIKIKLYYFMYGEYVPFHKGGAIMEQILHYEERLLQNERRRARGEHPLPLQPLSLRSQQQKGRNGGDNEGHYYEGENGNHAAAVADDDVDDAIVGAGAVSTHNVEGRIFASLAQSSFMMTSVSASASASASTSRQHNKRRKQ